MWLENNLGETNDSEYLPYIRVDVKNEYSFTITIWVSLEVYELYIILYSYIKNKNIVLKSITAIRHRTLGIEYINLINMVDCSYYEFLALKKQLLFEDNIYQDSNFLFDAGVSETNPLQIEINTFNKHKVTPNTKPKKLYTK